MKMLSWIQQSENKSMAKPSFQCHEYSKMLACLDLLEGTVKELNDLTYVTNFEELADVLQTV